MDNDFATGYALGADSNEGRNNGMFGCGDGGWIWIILLLALFGGFGFGGFGGGWGGGFGGWGAGGAGFQGMATRADINEGFALNGITTGITAIQQGICDSTYALNNAITGGFHGVERGFYDVSRQLADCCCENRAAIADLKYTMATENCATRNQMANATRDIIDAQNANARAIMDYMVQKDMATLREENQALKFSASQDRQNALWTTALTAQTNQIIGAINPPAVPSYQVPNPYTGRWGNYGNNGGCGCGWN